MSKDTEIKTTAKKTIHELYNSLKTYPDQNKTLTDITDVLMQVYKKLDTAPNPEALVNRLANYIYVAGFSNIHLNAADEQRVIDLGATGSKAGWNGRYMADFADKSQFFGIFDR